MKTRRQKLLGDREEKILEDRRSISRSSNSANGGINAADFIPIDLIIEILSRLPVKSIARCRCVSNLWSSIIVRTDFTDLVLARSVARPKLLLVYQKDGDALIFSSPQNPHENSSSIVANRQMIFRCDKHPCKVYSPVHGLLCFKIFKEKKCTVLVISNPSTGQSLTLPRVNTRRVEAMSFFGYDPIGKQFKLLAMTRPGYKKVFSGEHQVMTLGGNGKLVWRMIECSVPHIPFSDGICIDGVLYYLAQGLEWVSGIVCFDIRSEKLEFIKTDKAAGATLVNYKGKLATLESHIWSLAISEQSRSFELCVLQDAEKHEWTRHTYVLPPLPKDIGGDGWLKVIGVTKTGELVLSPCYPRGHNYFIYYNLERSTIIKVEIQGTQSDHRQVDAFVDHVQDVKLGGVFPTSKK